MDDIFVYGKSVGEHNQPLKPTLHKLQEANRTLNEEKCDFSKPSVEFLGTFIDSEGVHVSPKKVKAILKMKTPQDQTGLRRFLGMVNQLSKFQPRIAELSKPLRDLLSSKSHWLWSDAQQRMRMMRFTYSISHVPGKSLYTADTLSRAPLVRPLNREEEKLEADVQAYVDSIVKYLPATEDRLEDFRTRQQQDEVTRQLITYCSEGWPEKSQLPGPLKVYWPERSDLTVQQGLLMKGNRLVVPLTMRTDVLEKLHDAHQGIKRKSQSICMVLTE